MDDYIDMTTENTMSETAGQTLDEIKLYYEEVRDVNARTATLAKLLLGLVLGLFAYMFFGMQRAVSVDFASAIDISPVVRDRISHVGIAYGAIGIAFTIALQAAGILAITSFGTSRLHKTRYWRSISILRRYLHQMNLGVCESKRRAITLQTGLEIATADDFGLTVPSPIIRPSAYNLGYFLAGVNFLLFVVPFVIFVGVVDFCRHSMTSEVRGSLWAACIFSVPVIFIALLINSYFAAEYCRKMKMAQFITPVDISPRIPDRPLSPGERRICRVLRLLAWGGILAYTAVTWLALWIVDREWSRLREVVIIGCVLILLALVERLTYIALRQQSAGWRCVRILWRLRRPIGKIQDRVLRRDLLRILLFVAVAKERWAVWSWRHPWSSARAPIPRDFRAAWDRSGRIMHEYRRGRHIRARPGPRIFWEKEDKHPWAWTSDTGAAKQV